MGRACSTNENSNAWGLFVEETEGKRPLGRTRHKYTDSIKVDLAEIRWCSMDQIGLAQYMNKCRALLNAVTNPQVQ
jgi:hypothetical protein